jgi:hypothetical protein
MLNSPADADFFVSCIPVFVPKDHQRDPFFLAAELNPLLEDGEATREQVEAANA